MGNFKSPGLVKIVQERRRQVEEEGYDADHDDGYVEGELALAAADLLLEGADPMNIEDPWGLKARHKGNRIRQLEIAGALVAAELDRLLRTEEVFDV